LIKISLKGIDLNLFQAKNNDWIDQADGLRVSASDGRIPDLAVDFPSLEATAVAAAPNTSMSAVASKTFYPNVLT